MGHKDSEQRCCLGALYLSDASKSPTCIGLQQAPDAPVRVELRDPSEQGLTGFRFVCLGTSLYTKPGAGSAGAGASAGAPQLLPYCEGVEILVAAQEQQQAQAAAAARRQQQQQQLAHDAQRGAPGVAGAGAGAAAAAAAAAGAGAPGPAAIAARADAGAPQGEADAPRADAAREQQRRQSELARLQQRREQQLQEARRQQELLRRHQQQHQQQQQQQERQRGGAARGGSGGGERPLWASAADAVGLDSDGVAQYAARFRAVAARNVQSMARAVERLQGAWPRE